MKVQADGFEFEFPGALEAFVFDEKDAAKTTYHGLSHAMKAVDLVVELPDVVLFIEVKDFYAPDDYDFKSALSVVEAQARRQALNHLREVLVHKYRDTWVYRWAERTAEAPQKPVRYLCVLSLSNGALGIVSKELRQALPVGLAGPRWKRELGLGCAVLNPERWASAFPGWALQRL